MCVCVFFVVVMNMLEMAPNLPEHVIRTTNHGLLAWYVLELFAKSAYRERNFLCGSVLIVD